MALISQRNFLLIIMRWLQFIFAITIMGVSADLIHTDRSSPTSPVINYCLFIGVWGMWFGFCVLYTTMDDAPRLGRQEAEPSNKDPRSAWTRDLGDCLVMDIWMTCYLLSAGVSLAAKLGVHSCTDTDYTEGNSVISRGLESERRCREAQALTAVVWVGLAPFVATVLIILTHPDYEHSLTTPRMAAKIKTIHPESVELGRAVSEEGQEQPGVSPVD